MAEVETLAVVGADDIAALTALLADAVEHDASVGYVVPFVHDELAAYWRGVARDVAGGSKVLMVVRAEGRIVGTTQLELCMKPNGTHRAEVQKVLVHSSARRRGIGRTMLQAAESEARRRGRHLLVLDTESGSGAQSLYAGEGYSVSGQIPEFARGNRGGFVATTYMYKLLQRSGGMA
ncbi:MAG: GNAT family N-acetyltransferase [Betaproteobacteria bacterium]|nr:GNAT family N-acetyltransferase [Betaproteobacteria bacterium]